METIPTCTITYSLLGYFFRDEEGTFLGEHPLDFWNRELEDALNEMCAHYTDLDIIGYWDHLLDAFVITKVINNADGGKELTQDELNHMMYIAFQPQCVAIKDQETGIVLGVEL